ncbi:MAG: alpha/beta hydrolase, partial [Gemmatimonadaceae bacterium]
MWIAATLAVTTLFLAVWIVIPGPTYFFLRLSVGAPEVSPWLIVASLVAGALSAIDARHVFLSRLVLLCSLLALSLSITPLARFA